MEKTEITLSLDSERMDALSFYLAKENATVQKKMEEALRQLYETAVPEPVREYLDAKTAAAARPKRPARPNRAKTVPQQTAEASLNEQKEEST
ncbi:hypothetical protein D1646_04010 [Pseudoflavonifractor sp. 60]|uniref:DUF6103 family protein n=1 Tax=Pseudoflavonifractor sp. 60 TaxID=2304576 RepID=UPI00136803E8|nr:DUF6103 family protein [Pseudoflavonifractor sp. 60]NBI65988.1 hypothetical protein [Pseudoflavonifractor sp. 60]